MKKYISVSLSFILLLFLFGCSAKKDSEDIPPIPASFKATVEISYNSLTLTGVVTVRGFNYCSIDFLSPDLFKPLKLVVENDVCRLTYGGLSYEMKSSDFPAEAFGKQLSDCLYTLALPEKLEITKGKEEWIYKGTINAGEFTAVRDAGTGYIKSVKIGDNFFINVTQFEVIP